MRIVIFGLERLLDGAAGSLGSRGSPDLSLEHVITIGGNRNGKRGRSIARFNKLAWITRIKHVRYGVSILGNILNVCPYQIMLLCAVRDEFGIASVVNLELEFDLGHIH